MRRLRALALATAALMLTSCTPGRTLSAASFIGPDEAITSAAAAASKSVRGVYALRVASTGRQDGQIYLNSEQDYRDQRNLTVAIRSEVISDLEQRFGASPDVFLRGKRIAVNGFARRVRIHFLENGVPSEKYYYQTHVDVRRADQIAVVDKRARSWPSTPQSR